MAEMKQLWLARDLDRQCIHIFEYEPTFSGGLFVGSVSARMEPSSIRLICAGHKAPLTIGDVVDCRPAEEGELPQLIPELWVTRCSGARYFIGDSKTSCNIPVPRVFVPDGIQNGHRCRIAWDESGIRLIGTPERV